jgi:hypothetical protein
MILSSFFFSKFNYLFIENLFLFLHLFLIDEKERRKIRKMMETFFCPGRSEPMTAGQGGGFNYFFVCLSYLGNKYSK